MLNLFHRLWYALFTDNSFQASVIAILAEESPLPAYSIRMRLIGYGYNCTVLNFNIRMTKMQSQGKVRSEIHIGYEGEHEEFMTNYSLPTK